MPSDKVIYPFSACIGFAILLIFVCDPIIEYFWLKHYFLQNGILLLNFSIVTKSVRGKRCGWQTNMDKYLPNKIWCKTLLYYFNI